MRIRSLASVFSASLLLVICSRYALGAPDYASCQASCDNDQNCQLTTPDPTCLVIPCDWECTYCGSCCNISSLCKTASDCPANKPECWGIGAAGGGCYCGCASGSLNGPPWNECGNCNSGTIQCDGSCKGQKGNDGDSCSNNTNCCSGVCCAGTGTCGPCTTTTTNSPTTTTTAPGGPVCGNGICETGENCTNCAADCPCPPTTTTLPGAPPPGCICGTGTPEPPTWDAACQIFPSPLVGCCNGCGCAPGSCSPPPPPPTSYPPYGYHDSVPSLCSLTGGWACDPDDYSQALTVELTFGGDITSGAIAVGTIANGNRPDLPPAGMCGGNPNHGFTLLATSFPPSMFDGVVHPVYAYALDIGPPRIPPFAQLTATPRYIQCTAVPTGLNQQCNIPGANQVTLSWAPTPGAVAYYLAAHDTTLPSFTCPAVPGDLCTTVGANSFVWTIPNIGDDYSWWVYSCTDAACTNMSTTFALSNFDCAPPNPPLGISASCNAPVNGQATVTWIPVTGAVSYKLTADDSSVPGGPCPPGAGEACTGPISGTSYTFPFNNFDNYNVTVAACSDAAAKNCSVPANASFDCQPCASEFTFTQSDQTKIDTYCKATGGTTCPIGLYNNLTCEGVNDGSGNGVMSPYQTGTAPSITCQSPSCMTCGCVTIPPPGSLSLTCNSPVSGQMTMAWTAPSGSYAGYQLQVDNAANAASPCGGPYYLGDSCAQFTNIVSSQIAFIPNQPYNVSVYACGAGPTCLDPSTPLTKQITCSLPTPCGSDICGTVYKGETTTSSSADELSGIVVQLRDSRGVLLKSLKTHNDGSYRFLSPPAGNYIVQVAVDRKQVAIPAQFNLSVGGQAIFRISGVTSKVNVTGVQGTFALLAPAASFPGGYTGANPPNTNLAAGGVRTYSAVIGSNGTATIPVARGAYFLTCWKPNSGGGSKMSYVRKPATGGVGVGGTTPTVLEPQAPTPTTVACPQ